MRYWLGAARAMGPHAWIVVAMMALAPLAAKPAIAQIESREGIALQNQILQMRRDLQVLSQQVQGLGGSALGGRAPAPSVAGGSGDLVAQLLERVSSLEDKMRQLQGRIDEIDNTRQRQYDDLAKQIGDINFRLQNGAAGGPGPTAATRAPSYALTAPSADTQHDTAVPTAPAAPPRRTPELILQEGNAALARGDYKTAEAAAREALAGPRGPRTADTQFLLAQALSAQRNWAQAAVFYDDAYKTNRSGSHAAESLLGLAISLNALGDKKESCEALDQLHASFPNPRVELREPIVQTRKAAGCP